MRCVLFQIKRLKDLEQEKDALWCGLEFLDKARLWYLQRLEENRQRQDDSAPMRPSEVRAVVSEHSLDFVTQTER